MRFIIDFFLYIYISEGKHIHIVSLSNDLFIRTIISSLIVEFCFLNRVHTLYDYTLNFKITKNRFFIDNSIFF